MTTAESDPETAVLAAYSGIEQSVRELARPYGQIRGFNDGVIKLANADVIPPDLVPVLPGLTEVRNSVTHRPEAVDTETAKSYVETAAKALSLFCKDPSQT